MPQPSRFNRFAIGLSATLIAGVVVTSGAMILHLRASELRRAEALTTGLSHIIAEQTSRSLQAVDLSLDVALDRLAEAERFKFSLQDAAIHSMLRARVELMPQLRSMFIIDPTGNVASSAMGFPGPRISVADRDYFTVHQSNPSNRLFVGHPVANRVDGEQTLFVSRGVSGAHGARTSVVAASLNLSYIESLYDSIKLSGISPISLFRDDGTLVVQIPPTSGFEGKRAVLPALGEGREFVSVRFDGEDPGVTTYRQVKGFPFVIGVSQTDRQALQGWRGTAGMILTVAAINVSLVLGATIMLLRRQRRVAELVDAVSESNEQLGAMISTAMDAIVTIDADRRIVVFNPAAQKMFGYDQDHILGKPMEMLVPERFRDSHLQKLAEFRASDVTARMKDARLEIVGLRSDGTEFPIESTIAQVRLNGATLFTAILRDISDRRRAEDELLESHRELRDLTTSLQAVREQERTSIARELHDELGQQLLRLRMDLSWLSGRIKDGAPQIQEKIGEMKQFVAGTVDTLRRVTTQLRPPLLDDLGLAEAIQWQLDDFAQRTGIRTTGAISIDGYPMDEQLSINLFRIVQEALTNVGRHSGADEVRIRLEPEDGTLILEIEDNGHGPGSPAKVEHAHGLVGMRERALLLGGELHTCTRDGGGFCIRVRVPRAAPLGQA